MFSQKQPKQIIMKKLLILFCLLSMNTMAQYLDGAILGRGGNFLCVSNSGCAELNFQVFGTAEGPYTFIYDINGKVDTISSFEYYQCYMDKPTIDTNYQRQRKFLSKFFKQNELFELINNSPGLITFNLISISNSDSTVVLNRKFDFQLFYQNTFQLPVINACYGDEVSLDPSEFYPGMIGNIFWTNYPSNTSTLKIKVTQSEYLSFLGETNFGCAIKGWGNINMYDKIFKIIYIIYNAFLKSLETKTSKIYCSYTDQNNVKDYVKTYIILSCSATSLKKHSQFFLII